MIALSIDGLPHSTIGGLDDDNEIGGGEIGGGLIPLHLNAESNASSLDLSILDATGWLFASGKTAVNKSYSDRRVGIEDGNVSKLLCCESRLARSNSFLIETFV